MIPILVIMGAPSASRAADIEGKVVIKHTLTKRRVTAAASVYERGASVELTPDRAQDPLAFECTRVAIYLDGPLGTKPVIARMEQKNRRFVPDLLVVPAGSTVSFPNLDPIFHNVFSLSKPKSFDLGNYPKDDTRTVTFSQPGIVLVNCRLHSNMSAAIVVSPNQWSTVADNTGRFVLSDVPPGNYTIVAWHRSAGFFRQTVNVERDRHGTVEFLIPLDERGMRMGPPK